jgi:hypothetical protein
MSENANSSMTAADNATRTTMVDLNNLVAEEGAAPPTSTMRPTAATDATRVPPSMATLPVRDEEDRGVVADSQTEMSHALDRAEEALDTVKTWKATVSTIKRVMDTVSPILKVCTTSFPSTLR